MKEQQLRSQLQQVQTELQPLEEQVATISQSARVNNNGFVWLGLGGESIVLVSLCHWWRGVGLINYYPIAK